MAAELRIHNDYTVGWVCALPKEQTAAIAMLDQRHGRLPKPPNDPNAYILGSIGGHNIVVACLPKGKIGTTPAATVASHMLGTFPAIRFGLMVGIGSGIPPKVRLGDVVVSAPTDHYPGVVQWDLGKVEQAEQGHSCIRTGALNNPPTILLTALTTLETEHDLTGSKILEYLDELKLKWPRLVPKYLKSDLLEDRLFKANYEHVGNNDKHGSSISNQNNSDEEDFDQGSDEEEEKSCRYCDVTQVVKRRPREMRVHHGLIASGNRVIETAAFRDDLNKDLGGKVLCVEMEAAGLLDNFPCIVIRGICDYADSHKNKAWQEHAAVVAAAFAKELLGYVVPSEVDKERTVKDQLSNISNTVSSLEKHLIHTRSLLDRKEDLEILNWLTPLDYGPQQTDYLERRQPGTGQWLLDSPEYQGWISTTGNILFCPGIPGAGKTILTSIVVDHLYNNFQDNSSVGISYLYCNFRRKDEQDFNDLMLSLVKQLAQSQPALPQTVGALYNQHIEKRTRPSSDEICKTLNSVAACFSKVFIIVDALDECQASNGCRSRLITELLQLHVKLRVNVMATSRIIPEISEKFHGSIFKEICASNIDIARYLEGNLSYLPGFVSGNDKLQNEIKESIIKCVDGMFLLAQLHLDSLKGKRSPKAIRIALGNFVKGSNAYDAAYGEAMERIRSQLPDQKELAIQALSWIACAKRPLTTIELQHALGVELGTPALDHENLPDVKDLVSYCCGLVTIDIESNIIRLVHYTTQEFFKRKQETWLPNAQYEIMRTCITYLSFQAFSSGMCSNDSEFEERVSSHPVYDYTSHHWGYHARFASDYQDISVFLMMQRNIDASSQALFAEKLWTGQSDYSQRVPREMTGLHLLAFFGLDKVIGYASDDRNIHKNNSDKRSPLSIAAEQGHESVARLLLKNGAEADVKDNSGRAPLWYAAEGGHESIMQLLLEKGAEADVKDNNGRAPLSYAAQSGYESIMQLLLEKGAKADAKDNGGRAPLSYAARGGHESIIQLLLEKGAEADIKDNSGRTPLSYAAEGGHESIIQLLLEKGAEADVKDSGGRTPLFYAAWKGHKSAIQLLFKKGAEADVKDNGGRAPFSYAAQRGHESIIQLLLEKGAEADVKDNSGRAPLSYAAEGGHESIIQLLFENGTEADAKDNGGRAPLSYAAGRGHKSVMQLLFEKGAEADAKDNNGRTPLSYAAGGGHESIVQLLLEKGANTRLQDNTGRSPLFHAIISGQDNAFGILLADKRTLTDHYGSTALSLAARFGHELMVKQLLALSSVDAALADDFGRTPLWWAQKQGHTRIVEFLSKYLETSAVERVTTDIPLGGLRTFDTRGRYCDVCLASTEEVYYHCGSCHGGDFDICVECFGIGAHCLVESHSYPKS